MAALQRAYESSHSECCAQHTPCHSNSTSTTTGSTRRSSSATIRPTTGGTSRASTGRPARGNLDHASPCSPRRDRARTGLLRCSCKSTQGRAAGRVNDSDHPQTGAVPFLRTIEINRSGVVNHEGEGRARNGQEPAPEASV